MRYLFEADNLRALEAFCELRPLLAFDFDGTLAPIISNPEIVGMRAETEELFSDLCACASVAIITGRGLRDISAKLKVTPKYLIGNHGTEGGETGFDLSLVKKLFAELAGELRQKLEKKPELNIQLEDKEFSISLHYRNSPSPEAAVAFLRNLTTGLGPEIRIIPGKFVMNLVAALAPDKYSALDYLMKKEAAPWSFFIGDDDTDEDVFRKLDPRVLSVRVGFKQASEAEYYINDQREIDQLLVTILKIFNSARI